MKNKTRAYSLSLGVLGILFCPFLASASTVSSAVSYLKAQTQDAWITQALVAGGASSIAVDHLASVSEGMNPANDYAKAILALAAVGKNPTTFGDENYVAKLKTYYNNNQMGDVGLLNDDIWTILALASVYQVNSLEAVASKNYLLANQNDDGGWGYSIDGESDTNMTSAAIMALLEFRDSSLDAYISRAVSFLHIAQNDDGGFPWSPTSQWGIASDSSSDAWVISAINALGENPEGEDWVTETGHNPVEHLLTLQTDSDFFEYQEGSGEDAFSSDTTAYAVIALSGKSFPVAYYHIPEPDPSVNLIIKGTEGIICETSVEADTALNTIVNSASGCGFTYDILDMSFGSYLNQINDDISAGVLGWLYYVNAESPMVGAGDYELSEGDEVLWYFGEWGWDNPTLEEGGGSEVVVTVSLPVSITVPSTVTDATININSLATDNGTNVIATVPEINLSVTTSLSATPVSVAIPSGSIITAPTGWNGIINAPKIEANNSVSVSADSGYTADVFSVIEVGYGDTEIIFSKAVRLLIPGASGKEVGYSRNGNFTKITNTCSADSQAVGDALSAGKECKINVGSDLVIWTKHFTKFATYAQTAIQTSSGGGSVPITENYCQEVEYDEWQLDCFDGWQYRDVLLATPSMCSLTVEQEDLRKKQCEIGAEETEPVELEFKLEGIIELDVNNDIKRSGSEIVGSIVTGEADIITTGNINLLLSGLAIKRNIALELSNNETIIKKIISNLEVDDNVRYAVSNFITYGSATTLNLGAGERAGVINSFLSSFGKLPSSSDDWDDIIKIANGNIPSQTNKEAEEKAEKIFKDIFLRDADTGDEIEINTITYGLRPIKRSLEKEKTGIKLFQRHFNYNPLSAFDWDIVRSLSYEGK